MEIALAIAIALVLLVVGRLLLGYPAPDRPLKVLGRGSYHFVQAAGRALFPEGGDLAPSADSVDLPGYVDHWLTLLPPPQRTAMLALFLALEQAPLVFGLKLSRFSKLPADQQVAYLRRVEEHRFYYVRMLLVSLRMVLSNAYLDHPTVHAALGMTEREACQPKPTRHLAPDDRGRGKLLGLDDYQGEIALECDVVVVGTGAGGGVAAYTLARAGLDVVILEEGPFLRPDEVDRDTGRGMAQVFYEAGLRTMFGPTAVPTLQGRCVGGSTVPNSAIVFRIPDYVLDEWRDEHGVEGIDNTVLLPSYERVEKAICKTQATPAQLGPKNLMFGKACEVMGIPAEPFYHSKSGCKGCGDCLPACEIGAKRSTDISHIPGAVQAGARLYTGVRADRVQADSTGVRGVSGTIVDRDGVKRGTARIKCRGAVLSGGVFGTPRILKNSRLATRSGQVGRNLHAHPGAAIYGVFHERIDPWVGSTQGYGAFIDHQMKLEVLWSALPVMAMRMPGFGHELKRYLDMMKHTAIWDVVVRGTSTGRILGWNGNNPIVWFDLNQRDVDLLAKGMHLLGEMFFSVGAHTLIPAVHGLPHTITRPEQLDLLRPGNIKAEQIVTASTHLFGTCRMGRDPDKSVVDSRGQVHGVPGLYVCDSSVMPSGTGVNPQEPIQTLTDYFCQGIIEDLKRA